MSQENRPQNHDTQLANLTGIVLVLTFIIIFGFILNIPNDVSLALPEPTPVQEQAVAQVVPTDTPTPQPTDTPAPTNTTAPQPTDTPAPTNTAVPQPTDTPAPTNTAVPQSNVDSSESSASYDPALVEHGETLFVQCAACHGPDARGIPNLGKDLVESEFVAGLTDEALLEFIKTGRPIWDPDNTTGLDMPGKGGNPALTDEDIEAIIAYVRSLSAQPTAQSNDSDESAAYDPALVEHGETLFVQCAACHGPDARGIPNLGKDLVESEFVAGLADEGLLEFIKTGRPIWDPDNTTGLDMPGKGGNPALTDEDILAIIAYVRSLPAEHG